MAILVVLIFWVAFSIIVARVWEQKGRSGSAGFWFSLLLSPILGIALGLSFTEDKEAIDSRKLKIGAEKKCPDCGELVRLEARICRFCRYSFSEEEKPQSIRKSSKDGPWSLEDFLNS